MYHIQQYFTRLRTARKDGFNREVGERRQSYKRGSQAIYWLNQNIEDEEYDVEMDQDAVEDEEMEVKQAKRQNKK